jgi:hypothetical protein
MSKYGTAHASPTAVLISFRSLMTSFRDRSSAAKSVAWDVFASAEVGFLGFLQKEIFTSRISSHTFMSA